MGGYKREWELEGKGREGNGERKGGREGGKW